MKKKIILASASEIRQKIFSNAGISFVSDPSNIDEYVDDDNEVEDEFITEDLYQTNPNEKGSNNIKKYSKMLLYHMKLERSRTQTDHNKNSAMDTIQSLIKDFPKTKSDNHWVYLETLNGLKSNSLISKPFASSRKDHSASKSQKKYAGELLNFVSDGIIGKNGNDNIWKRYFQSIFDNNNDTDKQKIKG